MENILFISYHFPPCGGGGIPRIHAFAKYLPEFGFHPVVLTVRPEHALQRGYLFPDLLKEYKHPPTIIRTRTFQPPTTTFLEKVRRLESAEDSGITDSKKPMKRSRLKFTIPEFLRQRLDPWLMVPDNGILWYPYAVREARRLIRLHRIRLVFATGPFFSNWMIGAKVARQTNTHLVIDVRDEWVGNPSFDRGLAWRRLLESRWERRIMNHADQVICTTKRTVENLRRRYPDLPEETFFHLSNGFDPEYFSPEEETPPSRKPVRFVYLGSLTEHRTPLFYFKTLARLKREIPNLATLIQTRLIGSSAHDIVGITKRLGISNLVRDEPPVGPAEVSRVLRKGCEVCLIFQRRDQGGENAIPGKIYEYLASRKPILCLDDPGGATSAFLEQNGFTWNCPYEDTGAIAAMIRDLAENYPQHLQRSRKLTKDLRRFNRKEQTKSLAMEFQRLLTERSQR